MVEINGPGSVLQNMIIRYGGNYYYGSGMIVVNSQSPVIENNLFEESSKNSL